MEVFSCILFAGSIAVSIATKQAKKRIGLGRNRQKIDTDDASLSVAKRKNLLARRKGASVHAHRWNNLTKSEKSACRKQILLEKNLVESRLQWAKKHGLQVCVDFSYDADHSEVELRSLARQLSTSYSIMKQSDKPINLILTSLDVDRNKDSIQALERYGLKNWKIDRYSTSPVESFPEKKIIYLSPDADDVLGEIEEDTVYVIGGIVDRRYVDRGGARIIATWYQSCSGGVFQKN